MQKSIWSYNIYALLGVGVRLTSQEGHNCYHTLQLTLQWELQLIETDALPTSNTLDAERHKASWQTCLHVQC